MALCVYKAHVYLNSNLKHIYRNMRDDCAAHMSNVCTFKQYCCFISFLPLACLFALSFSVYFSHLFSYVFHMCVCVEPVRLAHQIPRTE